MNDETAKMLVDATEAYTESLNEFLFRLMESSDENERLAWRKRIGQIMGEQYFNVLVPVHREHPKYYADIFRPTPLSAASEELNPVHDTSYPDRKVYISKARPELLARLADHPDLAKYLGRSIVLMTEELDFEKDLEGWGPQIVETVKEDFIHDLIGVDEFGIAGLFETTAALYAVLGEAPNFVALYDRWFELERVEHREIQKRWPIKEDLP